jgi:hypothetical protein
VNGTKIDMETASIPRSWRSAVVYAFVRAGRDDAAQKIVADAWINGRERDDNRFFQDHSVILRRCEIPNMHLAYASKAQGREAWEDQETEDAMEGEEGEEGEEEDLDRVEENLEALEEEDEFM